MSGKIETSPSIPWKIRLFLAAYSMAVDASRRTDGTINRLILNLIDLKVSPSFPIPINGVTSSDITVDSSRNLWFRLFIPSTTTTTPLPLIIYFHGGGFAVLSASSKPFDDFCRRLARELPAVIISVNYRLSPEYRFPSQYDDGFDILNFVDKWEFEFADFNFRANVDLKRCFVAGDSAGGNLAHHVAVRASEYEFKEVKVAGLIAIQPFFGGEERTESERRLVGAPLVSIERTDWMWKAFLPDGSDRDHPAVNVFGPKSKDLSGLDFPRTLVFVGGFDPLQDWQKRYCEGLKKCGKDARLIEYPNAIHSFYGFPEFPESGLLVQEVKDFLEKDTRFENGV